MTARSIGCESYSDRPNADRDNRNTANAVARKLGITDVEAEVLLDQKSAVVARLQKARRGDLGGIVRARRLSQANMSNIRQKLFFALISFLQPNRFERSIGCIALTLGHPSRSGR